MVDESRTEEQLSQSGALLAPHLRAGLSLGPDHTVLEIGCGVGRLGCEIAPHVGRWIGADVSKNMLAIARDRMRAIPNAEFVLCTGSDLAPLPDASVDRIYCHAVFIHMDKEDLYSYLVDARRVLRPGGLFYFDVWNLCHEVGWLRWQAERALHAGSERRPVHRNQFSTPDELRTLLRMARWRLVHLAETFSLHAVVSHAPPGQTLEQHLGPELARLRHAAQVLTWQTGDELFFRAELTRRLREHGIEPEVPPEANPSPAQGQP